MAFGRPAFGVSGLLIALVVAGVVCVWYSEGVALRIVGIVMAGTGLAGLLLAYGSHIASALMRPPKDK